MALETLKGVAEIGGFPITDANDIHEEDKGVSELRKYLVTHPIVVDHNWNTIMFKFQSEPVNDVKIENMMQDFKYYLASLTEKKNGEWDTDALYQHAVKCISENSKDWQDFNALYGNDYTGVNGCQVDTLIHAALIMLEGLDKEVPSYWNKRAITNLRDAIYSLEDRKQERENRGVEGTSKE